MNGYNMINNVSEETFAAWLDGMLSPEEESDLLREMAGNEELQEILDANDQVEETFEEMVENGYELPEELDEDFALPFIEDFGFDQSEGAGSDIHAAGHMPDFSEEDHAGQSVAGYPAYAEDPAEASGLPVADDAEAEGEESEGCYDAAADAYDGLGY